MSSHEVPHPYRTISYGEDGAQMLELRLLKQIFQGELQLPWAVRDAGYLSVGRDIDVRIRTRKVRQVRNIERLEAELELGPLGDIELLEERRIYLLQVTGVANVLA